MPTTDLTTTEIDRLILIAWFEYAEAKRHGWQDFMTASMRDIDQLLEQRKDTVACKSDTTALSSTP